MSTAMYSGVSALKAQQTKLDVIGNNIANINTVGYKSTTVSFADTLSQTLSGATGANSATGTGGTNAKQIGTGVSVASTTMDMTTGSLESTGSTSDVAISGDGFFIVQGGGTSDYQFTRAGNFGVDSDGNLTVDGYEVCGWEQYTTGTDGDYTYNTQTAVEPINLFSDSYNGNKKTLAAKATTSSTISGSTDASADNNETQATLGSKANATTNSTGLTSTSSTVSAADTITITGATGSATVSITAGETVADIISAINAQTSTTGVKASWASGDGSNGYIQLTSTDYGTSASVGLSGSNTSLTDIFAATTSSSETSATAAGTFDITSADSSTTINVYDSLGNKYSVQLSLYKCSTDTDSNGDTVTKWYWQASSTDTGISLSNNSGYIEFDSDGKIVTSDSSNYSTTPSITVTPSDGAATSTVKLDMSSLTSYTNSSSSSSSSSLSNTQDGYAAGTLEDFTIGSDGIIYGTYSNGETQPLAMLALANFTNPSGLEKIGDSLYIATVNSGEFTGGVAAGTSGTGSLSSGYLEMSNVDLSSAFSDMMITQRAYQAGSKIITASDECMKAVINMVG